MDGALVETEKRGHDLEMRFVRFAARVCRIGEGLPSTRVGNHVGGQLIRCGTAPASNYGEAQGAESRRDFVHKLRLCLKEFRETRAWLRFLREMEMVGVNDVEALLEECDQLIAITYTSIATATRNMNSS